jgi:hypothetical protein
MDFTSLFIVNSMPLYVIVRSQPALDIFIAVVTDMEDAKSLDIENGTPLYIINVLHWTAKSGQQNLSNPSITPTGYVIRFHQRQLLEDQDGQTTS